MTDRCDYSDLPRETCAHCGATPGGPSLMIDVCDWRPRGLSGRALDDDHHDFDLPGHRTPRSESPCRYEPGAGWFLPGHDRRCDDHGCAGCQPCTARHCTCREGCREHVEQPHHLTAPRCIGRVRADLRAIEDLAALLIDEAVEAGLDSEAANLAGPTADPRKVEAQRLAAPLLSDLPVEDEHHPLFVLGTWDMLLRESYDQPTGLRLTLSRAADYLAGQLDRFAQDPEQDFSQFAGEIRACRRHLEAVLHDSRTPELGAPCLVCPLPAPRLVKRYAHWCDRPDCEREHDATGAKDEWRCPDCGSVWSEADYRLRVGWDALENAEVLTAADMLTVHGIKPSSVTAWATLGKVRRRGKSHDGRTLYDVADARRAAGLADGDAC